MSIFFFVFEKAGKGSGKEQIDDLLDESRDDLPDIQEPLTYSEAEPVNAESPVHSEPLVEELPAARPGNVVELDLNGLRDAGLVDPKSNKVNRTTEEFRRIKRPLLMNIRGEGASVVPNANMIMVTSSIAGEGKTFTSINLAMSIAMEMDRTVLLVDADVAKPDVT
jgi:receptor protein-tyrosine kinase